MIKLLGIILVLSVAAKSNNQNKIESLLLKLS